MTGLLPVLLSVLFVGTLVEGGTYVRWGRSDCPKGSWIVYQGTVGGSHFSHKGGAANYLCLTNQPRFDHLDHKYNHGGGLVYGAEYQQSRGAIWAFFRSHLHDKDVPCAVCWTWRRSVVMIPGTNVCDKPWKREYSGYLAAGFWNHPSASEYVCLDRRSRGETGSSHNHDGKLFYLVEGRCGSLNCPPYHNGYELTCAVCSKS